MSLLASNSPDSLDGLPTSVRDDIIQTDSVFRDVASSGLKIGQALEAASLRLGVPAATLRRKYYTWIKAGRTLLSLVDGRVKRAVTQSDARTHDPAFVAHWQAIYLSCQRNAGAARQILCRQWRNRTSVIPGYEDWAGWPRIPEGWSERNLRRLAPDKMTRTLMRQGLRAAAPMLPQVLATRAGLWPCSHVLFDDVWLDLYVLQGREIGIPLQLGCLDLYTGKRLCWGQKVRVKGPDGHNVQLRDSDMRLILAAWAATVGYSTRGTTLVAENGTAAISTELEDLLTRASNGLIRVDRSGITGRMQALLGGYGGRGVGNPRHKAALESWHNLLHNRMCDLPGARGHDRTEPEPLAGLLREESSLIKSADSLPASRRGQLRHLLLTLPELCGELAKIVRDINSRTDHDLEGWADCGFEVAEARLSETSGEWAPLTSLDPTLADAVVKLAADTGADLVRRRRMSPAEAWDASLSCADNRLITLPQWAICDILGRDMARVINVKSAYIKIRDAELGGEAIYEARVTLPDGLVRNLPAGKYTGFVNPFDPGKLFICTTEGRCIGVAPVVQRVSHDDPHAIEAAMGRAAARRSELLEPVRVIGAKQEADIVRTREHNRRVISGEPVTAADYARLAAGEPTPTERRAAKRAAQKSPIDVFAGLGQLPKPDAPEPTTPDAEIDLNSFIP